jgi:lipopolysaccharide transport system ATP-binding protein
MQDVGQQERTVLFVSHNMPAITRLCARAILLEGDRVRQDGLSPQVVSAYLNSEVGTTAAREWPDPAMAPGGEVARLRGVWVHTEEGQTTEAVDIRQPVGIEMQYDVRRSGYVLSSYFDFYNEENVHVFAAADLDLAWRQRPRPAGRFVSTAWIPGNLLAEGMLFVGAGLATMHPTVTQFHERDVVAFHVFDSLEGDSAQGDWAGPWGGAVRPLLKWATHFTPQGTAEATP